MSRAQAENLINNMIREIEQECAVRGHVVSDTLVAFMVKAVVLDPRHGFDVDRSLRKEDVQKLQELCLDKLMEPCSPSLQTLKMQLYFHLNHTSRRQFLGVIRRKVESRLGAVSRDITDSRARTREDLDALYRQIIAYTLLRSGAASPTPAGAVQEATAALHSVFPPTELGGFMVLQKKEKEQQLKELALIVTGIQLFNRAGQKKGQESQLLPHGLRERLPAVSEGIEQELSESQSLAWKYSAVLEKLTDGATGPEEGAVSLDLLRQALYNVRQHLVFLRTLQADAGVCAEHIHLLQGELSSQVKLLREAVQLKTAVPTAKVFPLFKALSEVWCGLWEEAELLSVLGNIRTTLQPFLSAQAELFSEAELKELLEASEVKTDQQRLAQSSGDRVEPGEVRSQDWLLPEAAAAFKDSSLQFGGFCGYTLVSRGGLLLPGNPNLGLMRHKEKLYAFHSKDAALKFALRPDHFITKVAENAKRCPELIQLLGLEQPFSCARPGSEMQAGEGLLLKPSAKCDGSTQTELHPVETNIVSTYEWNEWELRRKAIKLADLRTKVTHSTQTDLSHMRRENVTQTWLPKDAACQSKRDGESNVPRPQIYLAGLRGRRDGGVVKTDLTRSVDE